MVVTRARVSPLRGFARSPQKDDGDPEPRVAASRLGPITSLGWWDPGLSISRIEASAEGAADI
jgi:hypothetical protein